MRKMKHVIPILNTFFFSDKMTHQDNFLLLCLLICPKIFGSDEGSTEYTCREILTGISKCCADFYWESSINSCDKCHEGYMGINCSEVCTTGFYGEECETNCPQKCNSTCHHITGECLGSTEDPDNLFDSLVSNNPVLKETQKKTQSTDMKHRQKSTNTTVLIAIISSGSMFTITLLIVLIFHLVRFFKHRKMIVNMRQVDVFSIDSQTVPVYEEINESRIIRNTLDFEI